MSEVIILFSATLKVPDWEGLLISKSMLPVGDIRNAKRVRNLALL